MDIHQTKVTDKDERDKWSKNLTYLNLSYTKVTDVPKELKELKNLKVLCSGNAKTSSPDTLRNTGDDAGVRNCNAAELPPG